MINISRLLILSCLFLICAIISCDKDQEECHKTLLSDDCGQELLPFDIEAYNALETDSVSVMDVRLEKACLIIDFAYSGCQKRDVGVMAFLDHSSFIPVLNAKISNGPLEDCLAFFMHRDTFDLTSTGMDLYNGVQLNIYQWEESFILNVE